MKMPLGRRLLLVLETADSMLRPLAPNDEIEGPEH